MLRRAALLISVIFLFGVSVSCSTRVDARTSKQFCEVHGTKLIDQEMPITFGYPLFITARSKAHQTEFPNEWTSFGGGCVDDGSKKTALIRYCPDCRKAAAEWDHRYHKKMKPVIEAWEQFGGLVLDKPEFRSVHFYVDRNDFFVGVEGTIDSETALGRLKTLITQAKSGVRVVWKVKVE